MAINPESQYPGKITPASSEYPYGKARNITLPGDGTGTPWEAALVNDVFGFQQALLSAASIVPTGNPDKVGASQYLNAIAKIAGKNAGVVFATKAALQANTPVGGAPVATTLEAGMLVHTLGYNTAGDGGGAVYLIESGTADVNDLDVIQVSSNQAKRLPGQFRYSCGWIFDDGYANHKTVVLPLFQTHGAYFAFAPHITGIGTGGKLTKTELIDLNARGYEIINHSYSHPLLDNSVSDQFVKAEVNTAWAFWEELGIKVQSWLTPSSVLGTDHADVIRQRYGFAYTKGTSLAAMRKVNPFELYRVGIESFTTEQCKDALRDAVIFGGSVIFYAHDVTNGDTIYNRISDLLDYADAVNVPVELPTASLRDGVVGWRESGSRWMRGGTIFNRRQGWSATNGATVTVNSNDDIIVEATAVGQSLIQRLFVCNLEDLGAMTFSTAFRNLVGTVGAATTIGLKISDATNTTTIYQIEETIGELDTAYRRYSLSGESFNWRATGQVTVLLYVRADFSVIGDQVLLRDPILRYGTDVLPKVKQIINESFTFGLPAQTVTASGYTINNTLSLTDQADNGLFEISTDRIRFSKAGRVSISVSVAAYGTDFLLNSEGGMLFLDYGAGFVQASISAGSHTGGGSIEITLDIDADVTIRLALFNVGVNFPVSDLYSKVTIRELRT